MKRSKFLLLSAALVISAAAYSQTDSTWQEDSLHIQQPEKQYQTFPEPNFGIHYIGVLGNYVPANGNSMVAEPLTVMGDEENPGKIWIAGLMGEKIYALRKKEAGTYKIPVQKSGEKSIPEGTVIYDDNSKEINICLGRKFNDEDPSAVFNATDAKPSKSIVQYTGIKTDAGTAAIKK